MTVTTAPPRRKVIDLGADATILDAARSLAAVESADIVLVVPSGAPLTRNAVFLEARMGGLETYVRELLPALLSVRPELELCVYVNAEGKLLLEREAWGDAVKLVSHPLLGLPGTRALVETTFLGWLASRQRVDVLHNVALTAPLRTRPANVVLLADVTWLRQPETVGRARAALQAALKAGFCS